MSRREAVVAALTAALDGPEKPADTEVFRWGTRKSDAANQIRVLGRKEAIDPAPGRTAPVIAARRLLVQVECSAKRVGDLAPDAVVAVLDAWVVRAVKADETLGGLALEIEEVSWELDAETVDQTYVRSATVFEVLYETDPADPRAAPGEPPPEEE